MKRVGLKAAAIGTFVAAGAGYLAGILTAPKSGKETRQGITNSATKAKMDTEKQLKKLHSDLTDLVKQGDAASKKAKDKAKTEIQDATTKAKNAREKSRELLSALHNGDIEDPNLQAAVAEIKQAKTNLVKYIKKSKS
jgi:gas vesicle protein